jgi:hypothetical protein
MPMRSVTTAIPSTGRGIGGGALDLAARTIEAWHPGSVGACAADASGELRR